MTWQPPLTLVFDSISSTSHTISSTPRESASEPPSSRACNLNHAHGSSFSPQPCCDRHSAPHAATDSDSVTAAHRSRIPTFCIHCIDHIHRALPIVLPRASSHEQARCWRFGRRRSALRRPIGRNGQYRQARAGHCGSNGAEKVSAIVVFLLCRRLRDSWALFMLGIGLSPPSAGAECDNRMRRLHARTLATITSAVAVVRI